MSNKRKSLAAATIDFAKSVNVYDLACALNLPLKKEGRNYKTLCFVHSENTPSFTISPDINWFQCFGRCGIAGRSIEMYMYYHYKEVDQSKFREAVEGICFFMGHPVLYTDGSMEEAKKPQIQSVYPSQQQRKEEFRANDTFIRAVYSSLHEKLPLYEHHLQQLLHQRHFSMEEIQLRGYRSFPIHHSQEIVEELLNEFGDLKGVPGFYLQKESWAMLGVEGIMIPVRSEHGIIEGFQIRLDYPGFDASLQSDRGDELKMDTHDSILTVHYQGRMLLSQKMKKPETIPIVVRGEKMGTVRVKLKNKYRWFSSSGWPQGSSAKSHYHISYPQYGLPDGSNVDCSTVWVTEGPLKGDRGSEVTQQPFCNIPGISQWKLGVQGTLSLNPKHVIVALDADALKEKMLDSKTNEEIEDVGTAVMGLIEAFIEEGLEVSLAAWDVDVAKGIDDLFNENLRPHIIGISQ